VPDASLPGQPATRLHRHAGDAWVACGDHRHWGLLGAAGLLLARRDDAGAVTHVVLQHRALWSDQGGTWGVPGGALAPDESPVDGALRESEEEASVPPAAVRVVGTHVLDHGPWTYTTVVGEVADGARVEPAPSDPESLEVRWVALAELDDLPLMPAFAEALPTLLGMLER
jgi:septum formation protein